MDETAIKVENMSKDFVLPHERAGSVKGVFTGMFRKATSKKESQHALKDISLEIKKGEFFGIVGRNGSGKSTLLKILAGIYQPTHGKVSTYGKLVPFIELGVGFNPELTGRDNVYLNGAMFGFSKEEVRVMYDDIVAFAELERFMDQKLKNYSSGMQVRLAFSMATRSQADILLIDEVLAVGDADFQRKCFDYFSQLKGSETTVVFVSHNMSAVREYCDRAMLIEKSQVVEIGSTDLVSEKYSRLFIENTDEEQLGASDEKSRWGDGLVKTTKINLQVEPNKLTINQKIEAFGEIESPIIGFRIRSNAGEEITGTNTDIENQKLPNMSKGQFIMLTWELPNILSDGKYSIDPAILHAGGATVSDWWDEAIRFRVKRSRHLPYAIDPSFKLSVSAIDKKHD